MGAERLGRVCGGLTLEGLWLGVGYTLEGAGDCDDCASEFPEKKRSFSEIFLVPCVSGRQQIRFGF